MPTGGEFAANEHEEASSTLSKSPPLSWDEVQNAIQYDEYTPQASNPDNILLAMDCIQNGSSSAASLAVAMGMDRSEGGFYSGSTRLLGLTKKDNSGEHRLTSLGERIYDMDTASRRAAMAQLVGAYEGVVAYRESPDHALEYLKSSADLSPTTLDRRLSTLQSWSDYAYKGGVGEIRERASSGRSRHRSFGKKEIEERSCTNCFVLYPARLDECPRCE